MKETYCRLEKSKYLISKNEKLQKIIAKSETKKVLSSIKVDFSNEYDQFFFLFQMWSWP